MLVSRRMLPVYRGTMFSLLAACWLFMLNLRVYALGKQQSLTHKTMETPVGVQLPPFEGHDLQGRLVRLHELVAHLPPSVQPIVVDLWDQISPEYLESVHFPEHNVPTKLTGSTVLKYRLHFVPQTMPIDKQSLVLYPVLGVLKESESAELLRLAQQ